MKKTKQNKKKTFAYKDDYMEIKTYCDSFGAESLIQIKDLGRERVEELKKYWKQLRKKEK